ncbi:MAG: hypothetical protein JW929_07705 [Anaerolineales bacterium]|nr:hypothetical protein [Anaerolineales bacterium]
MKTRGRTQEPAPPWLPATWEANLAASVILVGMILTSVVLAVWFDFTVVMVVGRSLVILPGLV